MVATPPPFKPDYRIAKLSGLGVFGFLLGSLLLFFPDFITRKQDSVFHEIAYEPREFLKSKVIFLTWVVVGYLFFGWYNYDGHSKLFYQKRNAKTIRSASL